MKCRFSSKFWETLAYLANTLIFIIVGIVISEKAIFEIHGIDWFYMFSLYFGCFVIRGFVIALFSPVLRHTGYGMTWREGTVMTWGGLRGAVGLALALQVAHHDRIDQENIGVKVLIHVSGVVFLTLLVNATTIYSLLQMLGMSDLSPAKRMAMANALRHLDDLREKNLNMLKTDRFLADAEWETVEKQTEIVDPYNTKDEEAKIDDSLDIKQPTCCTECDSQLPPQYSRKELRDMRNEAIGRMLKAEKMSYWRQFEHGMLSREATRKLQECTEVASDHKGKFIDIEDVKKSWEMPSRYLYLERIVKRSIAKTEVDINERSKLWPLFRIERHKAFYLCVYSVIVFDMINAALNITSMFNENFIDHRDIFRSLNLCFVIFYLIECALKVVVQKKAYLTNTWHILCIFIIIMGIVDVILSFVLPAIYGELHGVVHYVSTACILLRTIRVFRLLEPVMPLVLKLISTRMSQHLSCGFDVIRGFVAGEEEVRKLIDHLSDHKDIATVLKQMSDNSRLEVIRCLGLLTKRHPEIALSIKTRQATRSVLNQIRDGIHDLLTDGILEEAEGAKLEKKVEERMKRLQSAPPSLPIPPPDKMLRNVSWLRHDEELINYIKDKAKLLNFNYDDVVLREGDPAGGIYILISGMVRLESSNPSGKPDMSVQEKPSCATLRTKTYVLDFMTSGNIIGEMGLLTHKRRSATVICETSVQMWFISLEDMEYAIRKFRYGDEPLEYRLWHVYANRIAAIILMKQPAFQGWTKEKIKLRLEKSYLEKGTNKSFVVDSTMSDVVLINGSAKNPFNEDVYDGPCYIPWTVFKLDLIEDKHNPVIILVVPSDRGEALHGKKTEQQRGHGAFVNSLSQLCIKHSKGSLNANSKWKKVQSAKSLGTLFSLSAKSVDSETSADKGLTEEKTHSDTTLCDHKLSNESYASASEYMEPSSSGVQVLQRDEFKIDMKTGTPNDHSHPQSPSKLRKLSSGWKHLKRRLSADSTNRPNFESFANAFRSTEILPDDLEYIEGGDIVRDPLPHHDDVFEDHPPTSQTSSQHILTTVKEEVTSNDLSNANENNASDGGTTANASTQKVSFNMLGKSQTSPSNKSSGLKSPTKLTPVSSDTKF
ncbi:Sodium/hydrogen exchanger 10 [Mactra antiquata]